MTYGVQGHNRIGDNNHDDDDKIMRTITKVMMTMTTAMTRITIEVELIFVLTNGDI